MTNIHLTDKTAERGYSIMEIIVTAAIIGVLVLIMTPVLTNRSREAKIRAAEADLEHLANAMERATIQTGYMYRLYVLDDTPGGNGVSNEIPSLDTLDGILDEQFNTYLPLGGTPAEHIFIDPQSQDLAINGIQLYQQILINETAFGWAGPYLNWHRDANDNDWPDDPWGIDYILFTKAGALSVYESTFVTRDLHITSPTVITPGFTTFFDRPTLLSLGPNGLPGDGTGIAPGGLYGNGDDIVRPF